MPALQFFIKLPTFLTILGQIFVFNQNLSISTILIKNENGLKIVKNVANFIKTCKTNKFCKFFRNFISFTIFANFYLIYQLILLFVNF